MEEELLHRIVETKDQAASLDLPASGNEDTPQSPVTAETLVHTLIDLNMTLSTCESCTGGLLAAALTSVPGVSAIYAGGFVTYTVKTKHDLAGVSKKLLKKEGAVSKKTARQMAKKTAEKTGTDCALSVTGNAGPDASEGKPVGLVYIGCTVDDKTVVRECHFEGDRQSIRQQAVQTALDLLQERIMATMPSYDVADEADEDNDNDAGIDG